MENKKYPLNFVNFDQVVEPVQAASECAIQLNNIANELARANEGIEGIGSLVKFVIPLLEEAFKESKKKEQK